MNGVAELIDDNNQLSIKRVGHYKVVNTKTRTIYGYVLEAGTSGTLTNHENESCVIWDIPPTANLSAFEVLRRITQPITDHLNRMKADNMSADDFASFDYSPKDLHATAGFITQFWKSTDEQVSEINNLIYPVLGIIDMYVIFYY